MNVLQIIDIMKTNEWSPKVVGTCLRVLKKLVNKTETLKATLKDDEAFIGLLDCIESSTEDTQLRQEARGLAEMLTQDTARTTVIQEAAAIEAAQLVQDL